MEKRQFQRTHYPCRLRLEHPVLGTQVALCQDISETGLFIQIDSDADVPVGALLSFQVVSGLPHTKQIKTQVVRADKHGLGLRFIA